MRISSLWIPRSEDSPALNKFTGRRRLQHEQHGEQGLRQPARAAGAMEASRELCVWTLNLFQAPMLYFHTSRLMIQNDLSLSKGSFIVLSRCKGKSAKQEAMKGTN